jgi:hypothetical protein
MTPPPTASFICTSGVLPEKARLDAAGAIKVNLRETCILLSTELSHGNDPNALGYQARQALAGLGAPPEFEAAPRRAKRGRKRAG